MGSAGSGKGTQADLFVEQFGYHKVEAGAVFRKVAKVDSPLGRKVKEINDAGKHASDDLMKDLMKDYISSVSKEHALLIDGYPRTVGQKKDLEELLTKNGRDVNQILAVWIKVDRKEAQRRLLNRAQCTVCRTVFMNRDTKACPHCGGEVKPREYDKPEAIKHRLDFFTEKTVPAIKAYQAEDKLLKVNGMQEVAHVFKEIQKKLEPHLKEK